MKKVPKQKKNKQKEQTHQHKWQQSENPPHNLEIAAKGEEEKLLTTDGIETTPPSPPMPAEPTMVEAEPDASVNLNVPLNLVAALKQKAALLAQNQQRTQWNQQRKVGKMVNAHVPKRFNRGG